VNIYLQTVRITIAEMLVYRLSFFLWRLRSVLNLFVIYFVWNAVYQETNMVLGYTHAQMMTYVLLSNILATLALSSYTSNVAGDIVRGTVAQFLVRPIGYFKFLAARETADKLLNVSAVIVELLLLAYWFKPPLVMQTQLQAYLLFAALVIGGVGISFFLSLSISFIAFWSSEVWAPRFVFFILIMFLAGSYFPLDILPNWAYQTLLATPFPYLFYAPTKTYLLGVNAHTLGFLGMSVLWNFLLYYMARSIWRKGMREFSFYGS